MILDMSTRPNGVICSKKYCPQRYSASLTFPNLSQQCGLQYVFLLGSYYMSILPVKAGARRCMSRLSYRRHLTVASNKPSLLLYAACMCCVACISIAWILCKIHSKKLWVQPIPLQDCKATLTKALGLHITQEVVNGFGCHHSKADAELASAENVGNGLN